MITNCNMAFSARFEAFFGKSSQVPFYEYFTNTTGLFESRLIKANQG